MKTAIEKAIEDIEGYRSFSDTIDIRFVCALLRNVYMREEETQLIEAKNNPRNYDAYWDGDSLISSGEVFYNETYKQNEKNDVRSNP